MDKEYDGHNTSKGRNKYGFPPQADEKLPENELENDLENIWLNSFTDKYEC